MEKIGFYDIHELLLETLEIQDDFRLEIIGGWYYDFLLSNEIELNLILPVFDFEFTKTAYEYVRFFTLAFNLLLKNEHTNFERTCLFDVFKYNSSQKVVDVIDYILDYNSSKNQCVLWGNDTITNLNKFLPVFKKDQINSNLDLRAISNTFGLFKSIRQRGLVNYPILIDLKDNNILTFDCLGIGNNKRIVSEIEILVIGKMENDDAADLEEELMKKLILNRINLIYPYSKRTHSYLLENIGDKRFELTFKNRFHIKDAVLESDILLLPTEFSQNKNSKILESLHFDVVNTNHNHKLYDLLSEFKSNWKNLDLNIFVAPFPKYWFLFINKGMSKENWLAQFKIDYPFIANRPIIKEVEMIISELHDLNWIEGVIEKYKSRKILYPELKGLRKKRLNKVFNLFKSYTFSIIPNVEFIELTQLFDYDNQDDFIYLNAFDVIDLVNIRRYNFKDKLSVVIPDFIYFSYQPWIKYHIFDYQSSVLTNKLRIVLDLNYITNNSDISFLRSELIHSIKTDIKTYNNKYNNELEEISINEIEIQEGEDFELLNSEEIEVNERVNKSTLIITTYENEEISIPANEIVLLQRDSFTYVSAFSLKSGDLFLLNKYLNKLIFDDNLFHKLSELPELVKTYQNELKKCTNIYNILKSKGISYASKKYFEDYYLISEEKIDDNTIRIPRRKNDWSIICDFLSIDHRDMHLAFIAYYGRSKKNRIRDLYKEVINLFIEKEYFGISESPIVLVQIENIIDKFQDIFTQDDYYNPHEIADSIASTIMNELVFKQVKNIKILEHELL